MFISCLRLSSSNMRIVSSHKQCVAELCLQLLRVGTRVPLGSSNAQSHFSHLGHCSGNVVHIPLLVSSLVGAGITVVPHGNTQLLKRSYHQSLLTSLQSSIFPHRSLIGRQSLSPTITLVASTQYQS